MRPQHAPRPLGRQRIRNRRGYALMMSMIIITFMSILGVGIFGMASTGIRQAFRRRDTTAALSIAQGGLEEGVGQLKSNPDWAGIRNVSLGAGTVTVSVTTPAGNPTRRIVTSVGTVNNGQYSVSRTARITLETGKVPPVFYKALATKKDFRIHGNVDINSSPLLNAGDVHANGDLELSGSAVDIFGQATASGTVSTSGGPKVSRGMVSGVPPMAFPEVDQELKNMALADGTTWGDVERSNGSLVKGKINGDLVADGGVGFKINGVVWVTGDLTIQGPITGKGTIIVEGVISLNAKFDYPLLSPLQSLLFITTNTSSTAVDLTGNRTFKGLIYAPNGGVRLRGTTAFTGGILAETIDLGGTPDITRWTDWDEDPPVSPKVFEVKGYEEL